jgi:hypothetical protein
VSIKEDYIYVFDLEQNSEDGIGEDSITKSFIICDFQQNR